MSSKATNNTNITLKCTLCPKRPNFSDVSHLLTHISSKAHLSHRFQLGVRSKSERAAKATLDEFDNWFEANDLHTLLASRLAAKDLKNKEKNKDKQLTMSPKPTKKQRAKKEKASARVDNNDGHGSEQSRTPLYRAPVPRMQLWSTGQNRNEANRNDADSLIDWENNSYETPTARRSVPGFAPGEGSFDKQLGSNKFTTPFKGNDEDEESGGKSTGSSAKLKGTFWPGMDLFDSATAEKKRMRNQRKSPAALVEMKAISTSIEPAEISYHANGDFRGSRDIFGSLSPVPEEFLPVKIPSVKKGARKTKLADKDVNAQRAKPRTSRARAKKNVAAQAMTFASPSPLRHNPFANTLYQNPVPTLNPLAGGYGRNQTAEHAADEYGLGLRDRDSNKRTFGVFQDGPQVSPGQTESPLESHQFDFSSQPMPYTHNPTPTGYMQASPTPYARSTSYRISGKENGQNESLSSIHQSRRSGSGSLSNTHLHGGRGRSDATPISNPLFNFYSQGNHPNIPYSVFEPYSDSRQRAALRHQPSGEQGPYGYLRPKDASIGYGI